MSLEEELKKQMGYINPANTCGICVHYTQEDMGDHKCILNGAYPLSIRQDSCCKFFKNKKEKK